MQTATLAFITTSIINIFMLLILLYLIFHNTVMSAEKTKAYSLAVFLTILVIIAEAATCALDELGAAFRSLNVFANMVGFSLSPFIPAVIAVVFNERLYSRFVFISLPILLNVFLSVASAWTGWIFSVSWDNLYIRGPLFFAYIISYLYSFLLLMISNHKQILQFQDEERGFLRMLYAIILTGTTIQVLFPVIHSTWHCTTLVLVMYYLFQRELQFKYDIVTNTLNRQAFEKTLETAKESSNTIIILFDLDKFKEVNDTYGHAKGDYCLQTAATIINDSFKDVGQCYRIGGDEFCVLAHNTNVSIIEKHIEAMKVDLAKAQRFDSVIPNISYGYSTYSKNEQRNILMSFHEADKKMYAYKKNIN